MAVNLAGKMIDDVGDPLVSKRIELYEAVTWEAGGGETTSDNTDSDGLWAFTGQDITKTWIIVAIDGTKKYLIDARNSIQLTELDLITSLSVNTIKEHTAASGVTIDSSTDIILDAGGTDIFLKDDGTLFGTLTNNSGELRIKSSSSGTTAATFTGANVTFAGTVDATTDFTVGTTVITDDSIVMTPSSSDTVTIAGATHGILNVTTVDAAGTAADVNIDADGEIVIDAADAAGAIFKLAGTAQLSVIDGAILPTTDNDIDLGSSSYQFKDAHINGTLEADAITIGGTNVVSGSLITTLGTISAGVWQGTDVGVAYGGTGASSLTDGGVLLGSGTSAVTAMAVLANSEMIVGDGTTDPVAESGATLRTSIGVGTGDSPEFTDLTISDDLTLNSDAAVLNMGAGNDFTITHDGTTGATLAGNPITITSAGAATWSSSAGALTLTSAAAATWSTAAGILTIDGDDGIILNTGGSGNVQVNESLLVGVDDTGYDVKFFGATAGSHMLWDESADHLYLVKSELRISADAASYIYNTAYGTTAFPVLYLRHAGGTEASPSATQDDDELGQIGFQAYATQYSAFNNSAFIIARAAEDQTHTARGADLEFWTTATGGSVQPTLRMTIDYAGIVTVAGEVSMTTLDIGGTNVTSTAAELNLVDGSSANSVVNSKAVIYGSSGELAGTLSTVAQGSVTSLGTLTALAVDNISLNANAITTTSGVLSIDALAGQEIRINDAQANVDFVIEGDSVDAVFMVDASRDNVSFGVSTSTTYAQVRFGGSFTATGGGVRGIYVYPTLTTPAGEVGTVVEAAGRIVKAGSGTHNTFAAFSAAGPAVTAGAATLTAATSIRVFNAPTGGTNNYFILDDANTAFLSTAGVWTDASQRNNKMGIVAADTSALTTELRTLQIRQYKRRQPRVETVTIDGETTTQTSKDEAGETIFLDEAHTADPNFHYGLIVDEAPACFKDASGKGIGAGYVSGFLLGVVQNLDARITALGG
jgi:hypothetical protein